MSFWIVPASCSWPHALLLGGDDVAGEHRQHRAVHRHRHRHLVERDAVEQDLHVFDRIDRHARLADVADHARMVGIVAAMGGEIEGHRHALTAAVEVAPIERVRFLGGGETGVLADRPRPLRVHRRLRAANERLEAGQRVGMGEALDVGRRVQRLDRNAFRRVPYQAVDRLGRVALLRRLRATPGNRRSRSLPCSTLRLPPMPVDWPGATLAGAVVAQTVASGVNFTPPDD